MKKRNIWKQICQASRKEFEEVYAELDIQIEECGESFYNKLIPEVLQHLVDKEIAVTDEGALCIFSHDSEVPLICRKRMVALIMPQPIWPLYTTGLKLSKRIGSYT